MRYRSYYYDTESGLYYLQSRYYNPDFGRFINADDTSILCVEQGSLIQYNLFAYCLNNPVNMTDDGGYCASNIIGGIIGGVSGAILGALIADAMGLKGWKRYVLIAGATVAGAALGAFLGPYVAKLSSAAAAKIASAATAGSGVLAKLSQSNIKYAVSNMSRLQHAFKHAKDLGFGNWNSNTSQQWKCFITSNLYNYTKTFQNTLGNDSVTGYYRYVNGMHVATYIYNSGPNQGLIATVVKLSAQQLQKFGLQ